MITIEIFKSNYFLHHQDKCIISKVRMQRMQKVANQQDN